MNNDLLAMVNASIAGYMSATDKSVNEYIIPDASRLLTMLMQTKQVIQDERIKLSRKS